MVKKLISKIKTKISGKKDLLLSDEEYKFSFEEIEDLKEQNKQKLENLKNTKNKSKSISFTSVSKKLNGLLDEESKEDTKTNELEKIEEKDIKVEEEPKKTKIEVEEENNELTTEVVEEEITKEEPKETNNKEEKESYINLSPKSQEIIMKSWNEIDLQQIDKDIIEGKDLINHNYNITYGDNAAKFVHDIRKRYEIVICYLIGFNNEKKGILNKTIFADKVDDEWKYLNKYIKLLEKIRNFRK